jgi:hypothetical protein
MLREVGFNDVELASEQNSIWLSRDWIARIEHRKSGNIVVEARK